MAARTDLQAHCAAGAVATILAAVADAYEETIDGLEALVESRRRARSAPTATPAPALRTRGGRAHRDRRGAPLVRAAARGVGVFVRRELLNTVHTPELDLELRDVLDHVIRAHEDLDMLHDRMSSLADTRLSMVAYRQNEITKNCPPGRRCCSSPPSSPAGSARTSTTCSASTGATARSTRWLCWAVLRAMWLTMRRAKWL